MKADKEKLLAKEEQRLLREYLPRSLGDDLDITIFNYDLLTSMAIIDSNHDEITEIAAANTLRRLKKMSYEEIVAIVDSKKKQTVDEEDNHVEVNESIASSGDQSEITLTSGRDRYTFKKVLDFVTEDRHFLAVSTIPSNENSKPEILFFERIKGPHPNEENAYQVTDPALIDLLHLVLNKHLGRLKSLIIDLN